MKTEHKKYLLLFVIIVIIFSLAVSFVLYSGTKDEKVNINGEEGDWYKITSGSISGYVNKSLIK